MAGWTCPTPGNAKLKRPLAETMLANAVLKDLSAQVNVAPGGAARSEGQQSGKLAHVMERVRALGPQAGAVILRGVA